MAATNPADANPADTNPDFTTPPFTIKEVTETTPKGSTWTYPVFIMMMVYNTDVVFGDRGDNDRAIKEFVFQVLKSIFDTFDLSDLSTIPGKIHILQDANDLSLTTEEASFYRLCYYEALRKLSSMYYNMRNTGDKKQQKLNKIKGSYYVPPSGTIKDEVCDMDFLKCHRFAFSEQNETRGDLHAKAGPNCDVFEVRKADGSVCFHVKDYECRDYTLEFLNKGAMYGWGFD